MTTLYIIIGFIVWLLPAIFFLRLCGVRVFNPSPVVGDGPPGRGVPHAPITAPGGTEQ
jgi:hypothetical protein